MITFIGLLAASWVLMTFTHETGHLLAGWVGGATLTEVELAPWRLPYSIHSPDPNPLVTLWGGPIAGVVVPVLVAFVSRHALAWFLADFCMLANGSYLAAAWITGDPHLDTQRLFSAGAAPMAVGGYCLLTIAVGYCRFRSDCIQVLRGPDTATTPPQAGHTRFSQEVLQEDEI